VKCQHNELQWLVAVTVSDIAPRYTTCGERPPQKTFGNQFEFKPEGRYVHVRATKSSQSQTQNLIKFVKSEAKRRLPCFMSFNYTMLQTITHPSPC